MSVILIIIGVVALCVFLTDLWLIFDTWQKRIHIGKYTDRTEWQIKLQHKAKEWINKSPTIRIDDQERFILWDIIRGRYRSATIQSWQDAGLLMGLSKEDALFYMHKHPNIFNVENMDIDVALLAHALKKKEILNKEDEDKVKSLFVPYNENGTVPYRNNIKNIRFVDTIGLACPFLNDIGCVNLVKRQIDEYDSLLLKGVFPCHAFDIFRKLPLGVYDWSRGIGWYIIGLTECISIDENKDRIIKLAYKMLPFQREDGGFNCMIFNSHERFESSGSCLAGILFINAYNLTSDSRFLRAAFEVEKSLMKNTRRDGAIDFAQGDTKGIGFYSNQFGIMPFVQGMGIYLSKKLDKYETNFG